MLYSKWKWDIHSDTIQTLLYEKFLQVSFTVNSVSEQINIDSIDFRKVKKRKIAVCLHLKVY